jgi:L-rhamnose-H+ transport protein
MIFVNPLLGTSLHAVGAISAAACYTPQKKIKQWSWQTYWMTQATFCWFLLPILGAMLTIPNLRVVLAEAPRGAMLTSFVLGMAYGVGGTAFGISIRYIGFSLTYAIAVGLSSVLKTLGPALVNRELQQVLQKTGAGWVIAGIAIGTLGIALCGLAGRLKERDLLETQTQGEFSLSKGLALSLLAGVLSAVYGFSLDAGQPIADVAYKYGAEDYKGNVIYLFSNTGAFITTMAYCLYLGRKHGTLGELIGRNGVKAAHIPLNLGLAALTGLLWYGQFFFYNLGHVRMGKYEFSSWAIHMIMLVLFSSVMAIALREWRGCRRATHTMIGLAVAVLIVAVVALTYGNYLGDPGTGS